MEIRLLVLFTVSITVGTCQQCAFIPGPISELDYTGVIKVDCDKQHAAGAGLAANAGDLSCTRDLLVYLYNCPTVPGRMFVNVTANLSTVTLVSEDSQQMLEGTFEGLENIVELRLEGFQSMHTLSRLTFRPLRSLERLVLIRFGANALSSAVLGAALRGLSGTPLRRIVMHEIYSVANADKTVNITALFQLRNVTIRELTFSNNTITAISGLLSGVLPDLNYICIGTNARYYAAVKLLLDSWLFLSQLSEMTVYGVPVPDTFNILPCGGMIPEIDSSLVRIYLKIMQHRAHDCFLTARFPPPPYLTKLSIHRITFTAEWHMDDVSICFEPDNNVRHLDLTGSTLPSNFSHIAGLTRLSYLNLCRTGIQQFPHDFLGNFPELDVLILVQLCIGPWLKHINNSFFGSCQTLREIHLGDCQLTTIPPSAFLLLPSLEMLNLSSNSLHTFDLNLSNNSNLTHLNLSGNAISILSEDTFVQLKVIAEYKEQTGDRLTLDLRMNPLRCLCNSTQFVRQLQDWVRKQEVSVPGFEEYRCLYTNGSEVAMSQVDVDQLVTQCSVLSEIKNGSDCPCDDAIRHRLELVRLSLDAYFCRNYDGNVISMTDQHLSGCLNIFKTATFIVPVVVGGVLALLLVISSIVIYRNRNSKRISEIIRRLSMSRIVRLGMQYVLARSREDPDSFDYDVFLYIHDHDVDTMGDLMYEELVGHRHIVRHDDFKPGLKLDTLLENIRTCRWLVPVLSQNFVDDGECSHFIARAQYSRPHAIVPVVWTPFHTDDLSINTLLDTAEPVRWPGDEASDVDKLTFWDTLRLRTKADMLIDDELHDTDETWRFS